MISFEQVTIIRGSHRLVENLSLTINQSEHLSIIGPSGAGKTSLLLSLVGVVPITSGKISINNKTLTPVTAPAIRRAIAFIQQEPVLGANVQSVRDALLLPFNFRANRNHQPTETDIQTALDKVTLDTNILDKPCSVISGGEKQRIAIARALLLNKKIILADEPTSALDDDSRDAVLRALSDPELTTIIVSHDHEWLRSANRIFTLENGTLTESAKTIPA